MDFKKLSEHAMAEARKTLVDHYDPAAFMVYSVARQNLQGIDLDGTEVDDSVRGIFWAFAAYHKKSVLQQERTEEFEMMMEEMRRMLTELYYQGTADERAALKKLGEKVLKM